ncbi:MAG: tRNA1(Val) (adenine(37)-N6)-methyltransferase [Janthinobacterium lividum]
MGGQGGWTGTLLMLTEATTHGTLLGGRVSYRQFRDGYRTGIEPVLLAATVQARLGARVIEAGCGAGAGLLCLASRVPGVSGTGIEQDPATAALARCNLDENGLADWPVLVAAVEDPAIPMLVEAMPRFDHAIANPPWHRNNASMSPSPRRDLARRAPEGALAGWTASLVRLLRDGGTLTMILPAALHAKAAASMTECGLGTIRLLPLWPLAGRPARIVLVQGTVGGHGDGVVLPGLVLHRPGGGYTEAAEAILRSGDALPMDLNAW